jgi:two-component sensor histidine kinase
MITLKDWFQILFYSYNILQDQINPVIDVEKIRFNMETAIPCGLIISELVTNSLKHAFPEKRKGEIRVSLKILNNKYVLVVSDDGVGLPNELDFKNTNTLGLQLVNSLVNQVDGEIELDKSHGAEFTIIFKESKYKERF